MINMSNIFKKYKKDYCVIEHSGLFDEEWYSYKYLDNSQSVDSLLHFLVVGSKHNYNPNPYFDCSWYLEKYPSVKEANIHPFVHYIKYGKSEGKFPIPYNFESEYESDFYTILNSGLFDYKWFSNTYSLKKGLDPIIYYLKNGVDNGLNPSMEFDTIGYLKMYSDVEKSGIHPFIHYIKYGQMEGRWSKPCSFDNVIEKYVVKLKKINASNYLKRKS